MKNTKNYLLLILLFGILIFTSSYSVELINPHFEANLFFNMSEYKGEVAILAHGKYMPGYFRPGIVFLYSKNKWTKLPEKIYNGKDSSSILSIDNIGFDSLGTIYVSGYSLYAYRDNKWSEFYINDKYRKARVFKQFVVDIYNNIWIVAEVNNKSDNTQFAEVYKFNGKKFNLIWKNKYMAAFWYMNFTCLQRTMAALPDGRVVIYRNISKTYPDFNNEKTPDIVFFNQDGSFETSVMITPSGEQFNNYDKRVSDIFAETKDKIWFTLNRRSYTQNGSWVTCCSGISLYENGKWYPFDESNGLFKIRKNTYAPVCKIVKFDEDKYLLIDRMHIFYMNSSYKLTELSWDDILKNSKFLVCNSYYYGKKGERYIGSLSQTDTSYHTRPLSFLDKALMPDGDLWLLTTVGLFIFNPNKIAGVKTDKPEERGMIYPNPAIDKINIKSSLDYKGYIIYNIYGEIVQKGYSCKKSISIKSLSSGTYFIRLVFENNSSLIESFIIY